MSGLFWLCCVYGRQLTPFFANLGVPRITLRLAYDPILHCISSAELLGIFPAFCGEYFPTISTPIKLNCFGYSICATTTLKKLRLWTRPRISPFRATVGTLGAVMPQSGAIHVNCDRPLPNFIGVKAG